MTLSFYSGIAAVFVVLSLVSAALSLKQWQGHGDRRWEILWLSITFGGAAVLIYLEQFDSQEHLSTRTWAAFGMTMFSTFCGKVAARARWRVKRVQNEQAG